MKRTRIVSILVILVMAVVVMADQSTAATVRYKANGDWFDFLAAGDVGTNGWQNNDGGVAAVVDSGDEARLNWGGATVTLAGPGAAVNRLRAGVDESGHLVVNNGGVLTSVEDVDIGHNSNGSQDTGSLTVNDGGVVNVGRILWAAHIDAGTAPIGIIDVNSGGVINVASHMWLGIEGAATINISGTIQQNGGILGLGTSNASSASIGGSAIVNILDGGLFALNNIDGGGNSIFAGSGIDITGSGELTVPNDFVGVLTTYANNGFLGGLGVPGMSNLTIDLTKNPGFTTAYVTVIPEPSTIVLLGLGFGGLFVRKRR
jgi:hypothetical protein